MILPGMELLMAKHYLQVIIGTKPFLQVEKKLPVTLH